MYHTLNLYTSEYFDTIVATDYGQLCAMKFKH